MPVSDDRALQQFQIEALQRINDNLRLLNSGQQKTVEALHAIDVRLTKIEAGDTAAEVASLKEEVAGLKDERSRREGAQGAIRWLFPNAQAVMTLLGFIILVIVILQANGKL